MTEHKIIQPSDEHDCPAQDPDGPFPCMICDGGLAKCGVCRMAECELDEHPECPGPKFLAEIGTKTGPIAPLAR